MGNNVANRRSFLCRSAAAVAAAGAMRIGLAGSGLFAQANESQHAIRLGAPLPNPPEDPEELALAHRKLGYRAAYCPNVALGDKDRIRDIEAAFAKHDVVIAEVGRWCNLMEADPQKRAENFASVTEGLALADAVGARCCVDIAGSYNKTCWFGPDPGNFSQQFFDEAVENARKIIDAVKPQRAKFGYEMMGWSMPDTADRYLKMIQAVDRKEFAVHLDPCNAINSPAKFYAMTDVLNELFDKLGPWIVSCHAKDLAWEVEMNVHFREVCLGAGAMDYATYLKRLAKLPNDAPLMIEHMKDAEEYDKSRQHLQKMCDSLGIQYA